ncbi:MAG: hypothetical protein WD557_01065 [Dehalococcoidia bacterium]
MPFRTLLRRRPLGNLEARLTGGQNQRSFPSFALVGSFLRFLMTFGLRVALSAFAFFSRGAGASPSNDQKRQPLQATPPMTALPAEERLLYVVPPTSKVSVRCPP